MSTIEKAVDSFGAQASKGRETAQDAVERAGAAIEAAAPPPKRHTPEPDAFRHDKVDVEVPVDDLHERGHLTPAKPRSQIAEEYRAIKRPLLHNAFGKKSHTIEHANLIMVTSALQGDGKTFTSINLAMSIAMEQDKTVLFVDADVLKATAGAMLGVPGDRPGLIDVLRDEARPEDVILRSSIPKLRILPAGAADQHATELLAGDKMHSLMLELAARYPDRVIVFDSPPLLLTSEAGVLAGFMGQIVFVASANATPQQAVKQGLERIDPNKMVGMVLNRAPRHGLQLFGYGGRYGYSYGYGYGYGYGERDRAAAADLSHGGATTGESGQDRGA